MNREILVCPSCRGALEFAGTARCKTCGKTYESDGEVVDFLGGEPGFSVSGGVIAKGMFDHLDAVIAELTLLESSRGDGRGGGARKRLGALLGGLSDDEAARMLRSFPPSQLLNDLKVYFGRAAAEPETSAHRFLQENFSIVKNTAILNIGCFTGRNMLLLPRTETSLVGIDVCVPGLYIGSEAWRRTQSRTPLWCGCSVLEMPFRGSCFTHVVSFIVFGHVPLKRAFEELNRVLSPGGQLIFTVEGPGFLRERWDATPRFDAARLGLARWWLGYRLSRLGVRWQEIGWMKGLAGYTVYSPEILESELKEAGFEIEKIEVLRRYGNEPRLIGVSARKSSKDATLKPRREA